MFILTCFLLSNLLIFACTDHLGGNNNTNCSTDTLVTHTALTDAHPGYANFAWLVTPCLLGFGLFILIYKCCKDGLCNCQRLRNRTEHHFQGYHAVGEPSMPCPGQPVLFMQNETICIAFDRHRLGSHHIQITAQPPSYEDAVCAQVGIVPCSRPPSYSNAQPPRYSSDVSDVFDPDDLQKPSSTVRVHHTQINITVCSHRRRHKSAHELPSRHRHSSGPDRRGVSADPHRCLSLTALREVFHRNMQSVDESADTDQLLEVEDGVESGEGCVGNEQAPGGDHQQHHVSFALASDDDAEQSNETVLLRSRRASAPDK